MRPLTELSEPALVWLGNVMLEGRVAVPRRAVAAVVFASAPSLPDALRDEEIVSGLFDAKIATVYVPLLTDEEQQFDARTANFRFDVDFLAQRFIEIAQWTTRNRSTASMPVGYIASSGAAAAAIVAAATRPDLVSAVAAIDGRTDLAVESLRDLKAPTLLVVKDMPVLRMNREALTRIRAERRLEIVHGIDGHAVDCVAHKAVHWMEDRLATVAADAYGIV
ncbi:MAG TPA: alpha/beta hydrolase [Thermoanaerobaculia bacterium]|nr:alpha/beta hydrolase [Thermoanaerobaculia bacterium]